MTSLNLVAWDVTNTRFTLTGKDASLVGTGSGSNRSGEVALAQGSQSQSVTFSTPMSTSNYTINVDFYNNTDMSVLYQDMSVISRTVNGFTATWNVPLDTGNYFLDYTASTYGYALLSGSTTIPLGATSVIVIITPAFTDTNYIVTLSLSNGVDTTLVYQPLVITNKTTSSFTVNWNAPMATANYLLEYHVNIT